MKYCLNIYPFPKGMVAPWYATIKGRTVKFELPVDLDGNLDPDKEADLAVLLADLPEGRRIEVNRYMKLFERGGKYAFGGWSQIVAAVDGAPLTPAAISDKLGDYHATFYAEEAIIVRYDVVNSVSSGEICYVCVDPHTSFHLSIKEVLIATWQDSIDNVQVKNEAWLCKLKHFPPIAAMKAAEEKAKCKGCKHAHYVKTER